MMTDTKKALTRLDFVIAVINAIGDISKQEAIDAIIREWNKLTDGLK